MPLWSTLDLPLTRLAKSKSARVVRVRLDVLSQPEGSLAERLPEQELQSFEGCDGVECPTVIAAQPCTAHAQHAPSGVQSFDETVPARLRATFQLSCCAAIDEDLKSPAQKHVLIKPLS